MLCSVLGLTYTQEEIRDLLSKDHKKRLELREKPDTGVYVKVSWDANMGCGEV